MTTYTATPIYGPVEPLTEYRLGPHLVYAASEVSRIRQTWCLSSCWWSLLRAFDALDAEHAKTAAPLTDYRVRSSDGRTDLWLTVEEARTWMCMWDSPPDDADRGPGCAYRNRHRAISEALRAAGVTA